jgi:ADP-ribosylglycohydrolase
MLTISKSSGCLFGLALGDAFGAPAEFLSYEQIIDRWPEGKLVDLEGNPIPVTDDTQMTIAVAEAISGCKSSGPLTPDRLESSLAEAFVQWLNSPDNNRSPGMTCLKACAALEAGKAWPDATVTHSKGCGANMRVAPVGLLEARQVGLSDRDLAAVAQFQAAITHGHPTALAASDLTAHSVSYLARGGDPALMIRLLLQYAESQRRVYHEQWLGRLWERPGVESPQTFIERGWLECISALGKLEAALEAPNYTTDPCLATGAGWVAEEALATGLLCFLMYPELPRQALQRAATTSGDSDSIACLTGAFAGAHLGINAWPTQWIERIEYRDRLSGLAATLIDLY